MEKVDFVIGSEKRFGEFISSLNEKDKIALISHTDLDGITAARVANAVLDADLVKFVDYANLNLELVKELKDKKIKKVVFTDLSFDKGEFVKEIEKFASILSLDHHPVIEDFNSEKSIFISTQGNCAAYLCYYLFSKLQNLEKLDWLVACACLSDHMYDKNWEWMKSIYQKYGENIRDIKDARKGRMWELQNNINLALVYFDGQFERVYESIGEEFGDIGDLEKYSSEIREEIESCKKKFIAERESYGDIYFWEFKSIFPIKVPLTNELSLLEQDKTYIIIVEDGKYCKISARRQDKGEDMGLLLKKLTSGFEDSSAGGHIPAAGAHILLKDKEKFKRRLKEYAKI